MKCSPCRTKSAISLRLARKTALYNRACIFQRISPSPANLNSAALTGAMKDEALRCRRQLLQHPREQRRQEVEVSDERCYQGLWTVRARSGRKPWVKNKIFCVLLIRKPLWISTVDFERQIYISYMLLFEGCLEVFYLPLCHCTVSLCNRCWEKLHWHTSCLYISAEGDRFIAERNKSMSVKR